MACARKVALIVNCGFARVSVYQNSNPSREGPNARQTIDTQSRLTNFQSQFGNHPSFCIPEGYFEPSGKRNTTQFNRDCNKLLDGFKVKFRVESGYGRASYLDTFSLARWLKLSTLEKNQHTLSKCNRCFELYKEHQSFKPFYDPILTVDEDAFESKCSPQTLYITEADISFTDALIKTKTTDLAKKKTTKKKRKEKRDTQKNY